MTFGIPIDKIPVSPNGELKNQLHRKWVGLQKKVESEQWNGLFGKAILLPSHSDVLIGRGGPIQNHSGNQWLGLIVESLYPRYDEATKPDKANIASDIATKVKGIGARFLKQEGGIWVEANDEEAREKICIAFRSFRSYQKDGKNTKFDRGQDLKKRGLDKTGGV